jgi:tRNA (guanine-N7-)-methyltransferase
MGKNKLKKFKDMEAIDFVFQYPFSVLKENGFPLKGRWHSDFFKNDNPIVLELGCGKGEYALTLATRFPDKNFIGVDIKGARMWTGATEAQRRGLTNIAFIRTSIELIEQFFDAGEVSEIWITFPDPQMKKVTKRLTSTRFLEMYRHIFGAKGGRVHLKTDSPFLYTYTSLLAQSNNFDIVVNTSDLYADQSLDDATRAILDIKTHYEQQWLERGLTIKYISFNIDDETRLDEIDVDIEHDTYRSYSRGQVQCPELCEPAVTFHTKPTDDNE